MEPQGGVAVPGRTRARTVAAALAAAGLVLGLAATPVDASGTLQLTCNGRIVTIVGVSTGAHI
jgi:hypothetical protein